MSRVFALVCAVLIVLTGCVPPTGTPHPATDTPRPATVTPGASPIQPLTPFVSPLPLIEPVTSELVEPMPVMTVTAALTNANFENPFKHPIGTIPEFTVAGGWTPWWRGIPPCLPGFNPPCKPGSAASPIEMCPRNCLKTNGQCGADYGCYWARPEFKQMWWSDYLPRRTYEISSSQGSFTFGRMGEWGVYQRVYVGAGNLVTFTLHAEAWMCFDGADCKLGHMNDARKAELVAAWGCSHWYSCRNWTASDLPVYLRPDLPRASERITPTMHLKLGVDPTGTFVHGYGSPNLSNVVWGAERDAFDVWTPLVVTATARSDYVVVLSHAQPEWPYAHPNNDVYWDAAMVVVEMRGYRFYLPVVIR